MFWVVDVTSEVLLPFGSALVEIRLNFLCIRWNDSTISAMCFSKRTFWSCIYAFCSVIELSKTFVFSSIISIFDTKVSYNSSQAADSAIDCDRVSAIFWESVSSDTFDRVKPYFDWYSEQESKVYKTPTLYSQRDERIFPENVNIFPRKSQREKTRKVYKCFLMNRKWKASFVFI